MHEWSRRADRANEITIRSPASIEPGVLKPADAPFDAVLSEGCNQAAGPVFALRHLGGRMQALLSGRSESCP